MGIVLTDGRYYVRLTDGGGVRLTPRLSEAKVFSGVNVAVAKMKRMPERLQGFYPFDTEGGTPWDKPRRPYIPREIKDTVYDRAGGRCVLCGKILLPCEGTIDHIVPVVDGGGSDLDNLQLTCFACNQAKGRFKESEFLAVVENIFLHQITAKGRVRGKICRMMAKGMV